MGKRFAKSNCETIKSVITIFLSDSIPQTIFSSMHIAHRVRDIYLGLMEEETLFPLDQYP